MVKGKELKDGLKKLIALCEKFKKANLELSDAFAEEQRVSLKMAFFNKEFLIRKELEIDFFVLFFKRLLLFDNEAFEDLDSDFFRDNPEAYYSRKMLDEKNASMNDFQREFGRYKKEIGARLKRADANADKALEEIYIEGRKLGLLEVMKPEDLE